MKARRVLADFVIFSRGYFRNPIALFFSLFFPIILILLFGFIFGASGSNAVTLYTMNLDHNSNVSEGFIQALDSTHAVQVKVVDANLTGSFAKWLAQNGYPVGLVIPQGFAQAYLAKHPVNVTLYTDPQDQTSSGIAFGATNGVISYFNLRAGNATSIVGVTSAQVGGKVLKYIDYLVPGLIGFSILTSPMFSMVDISATYRKEHLFRQLSLTPLTKSEWLTAKILWYIALTIVAAVVMILIGTLAFGATVTLTLPVFPFLILGPFFFVSLGMLAGSVARTPESAAVIGNIITFPMMFLSGTFFPVSQFSPPLQVVAHIFPLYYIIDGMNQVMLFANSSRALLDVVIILAGSIVVFIAAIIAFRWREE